MKANEDTMQNTEYKNWKNAVRPTIDVEYI